MNKIRPHTHTGTGLIDILLWRDGRVMGCHVEAPCEKLPVGSAREVNWHLSRYHMLHTVVSAPILRLPKPKLQTELLCFTNRLSGRMVICGGTSSSSSINVRKKELRGKG